MALWETEKGFAADLLLCKIIKKKIMTSKFAVGFAANSAKSTGNVQWIQNFVWLISKAKLSTIYVKSLLCGLGHEQTPKHINFTME